MDLDRGGRRASTCGESFLDKAGNLTSSVVVNVTVDNISSLPVNNPPNEPSNPTPLSGAMNISKNIELNWSCADPDGDPITYDLYWGTVNPPVLLVNELSERKHSLENLVLNTVYYWQVIAKDDKGFSLTGPVWKFITGQVSLYGIVSGTSDFDRFSILVWPESLDGLTAGKIISAGVDNSGEYRIEDLAAGKYNVCLIEKNSNLIQGKILSVTVVAGQSGKVNFVVSLSGEANSGVISGEIADKNGNSLGGLVCLNNAANELAGLGIKDGMSGFKFSGLADGEYQISVNNEFYCNRLVPRSNLKSFLLSPRGRG